MICAVADLKTVVDALADNGVETTGAGLEYIAKDTLDLSPEDEEKLFSLMEAIEEDDDVSSVYTNAG